MSTLDEVSFPDGEPIGIGKYTTWGDFTTIGTLSGGGYIGTSTTPNVVTSGASAGRDQMSEIIKQLRQLKNDITNQQYRTEKALAALSSKIEAMHQMIEADSTLADRKSAERKIAALEVQLSEFREYYDEVQEDIYKK